MPSILSILFINTVYRDVYRHTGPPRPRNTYSYPTTNRVFPHFTSSVIYCQKSNYNNNNIKKEGNSLCHLSSTLSTSLYLPLCFALLFLWCDLTFVPSFAFVDLLFSPDRSFSEDLLLGASFAFFFFFFFFVLSPLLSGFWEVPFSLSSLSELSSLPLLS